MCQSLLLDALQFLEPLLLFVVELSFAEGQEYQTAEQCDICSRHFLSGHDHAAIHGRGLSLLIVVDVDPGSSGTVPDSFQEFPLVQIQVVLVFVQMNEGIRYLRDGLRQRRLR